MLGLILRLIAAGEGNRGAGEFGEKFDEEISRARDSWDDLRHSAGVRNIGRFLGYRGLDTKPDMGSRDHGGIFDLSELANHAYRLWNYRGTGDTKPR